MNFPSYFSVYFVIFNNFGVFGGMTHKFHLFVWFSLPQILCGSQVVSVTDTKGLGGLDIENQILHTFSP